jgi:hypothetical protein
MSWPPIRSFAWVFTLPRVMRMQPAWCTLRAFNTEVELRRLVNAACWKSNAWKNSIVWSRSYKQIRCITRQNLLSSSPIGLKRRDTIHSSKLMATSEEAARRFLRCNQIEMCKVSCWRVNGADFICGRNSCYFMEAKLSSTLHCTAHTSDWRRGDLAHGFLGRHTAYC